MHNAKFIVWWFCCLNVATALFAAEDAQTSPGNATASPVSQSLSASSDINNSSSQFSRSAESTVLPELNWDTDQVIVALDFSELDDTNRAPVNIKLGPRRPPLHGDEPETTNVIISPATKSWKVLEDPQFSVRYVQQPGFSRWHFRVAGVNPLSKNDTNLPRKRPNPVLDVSVNSPRKRPAMVADDSPSPPEKRPRPASTDSATHPSNRPPPNQVELRPLGIAIAHLRPEMIPVPRDVLGVIAQKATVGFDVFYLLSPELLADILGEAAWDSMFPLPQPGRVTRSHLDDWFALTEKFNILEPDEAQQTATLSRPNALFAILNDPINGDGTSRKLGELRQRALLWCTRWGIHRLHRKHASWSKELRGLSNSEAESLLLYLQATTTPLLSATKKVASFFNRYHRFYTDSPEPRADLLGDIILATVARRQYEAINQVRKSVLNGSSIVRAQGTPEWHGLLKAQDIRRYPHDLAGKI